MSSLQSAKPPGCTRLTESRERAPGKRHKAEIEGSPWHAQGDAAIPRAPLENPEQQQDSRQRLEADPFPWLQFYHPPLFVHEQFSSWASLFFFRRISAEVDHAGVLSELRVHFLNFKFAKG